MSATVADVIVRRFWALGVERIYGHPGDGRVKVAAHPPAAAG